MSLFEKHRELIEAANLAIDERTFYTPYPEHHKAWGEEGLATGLIAFESRLGKRFQGLGQNGGRYDGSEVSPYSREPLGVTYPILPEKVLIQRAEAVRRSWKHVSPHERAGLLVEVLERLKGRFFELAYATMHTTGQSFVMAFQASGPHSSDRALEATVLGARELTRYPKAVRWEKPMGKTAIKLDKAFRPIPRGIALVISCSTFPVWNTVPGLFANLVCGNPVLVKPHPGAVLPIAIVVEELRATFKEFGIDPDVVQLAADKEDRPIARHLAENPAVKVIDYTGGNAFGDFLEGLTDKVVFTEKSGVNPVIIDSAENLDAVCQNLAFSVSLFSGQMCTAPQNFFIPSSGVREGEKVIPYKTVVQKLKKSIEGLTGHPKVGPGTVAALQNDTTLLRVKESSELGGKILLSPKAVEHAGFPNARSCTPTLLETTAANMDLFESELFGPISVIVKTKDTQQSVALASDVARRHGAITCAAYTTDPATEAMIREEMEEAFVPVSFNLTGYIWVNQAAAFSDFHVTGGNPAGNASFSNPEYINKRFVWVGHRRLVQD